MSVCLNKISPPFYVPVMTGVASLTAGRYGETSAEFPELIWQGIDLLDDHERLREVVEGYHRTGWIPPGILVDFKGLTDLLKRISQNEPGFDPFDPLRAPLLAGAVVMSSQNAFYKLNTPVALGGTIDMTGTTARKVTGRIAHRSTPHYSRGLSVFPRPVDSSNLTPTKIVQVLEAIGQIEKWRIEIETRLREWEYPPSQKGGIFLSMGSDTAGRLALITDLELVRLNLPTRIAIAVAHSPAEVKGSDAIENRTHASAIAADERLPSGVYAPIGSQIHPGADLVKTFTKPSEGGSYFRSYGELLGRVRFPADPTEPIDWNQGALAARKEIRGQGHVVLSRWKDFQDAPKEMGYIEHLVAGRETPIGVFRSALNRIKKRLSPSTQGALVIYGRFYWREDIHEYAHASSQFLFEFQQLLREAKEAGILIYTVSRKTATAVNRRRESYETLTHQDFIRDPLKLLPRFFSYERGSDKLAWLLRYYTPEHAAELMSENLAGELPILKRFPQDLRKRGYPWNNPARGNAVVVSFLGMGPDVFRDAVDSFPRKGYKGRLYVYGWGDGNLPFEADNIHELLVEALQSDDLPSYLHPLRDHLSWTEDWKLEKIPKNLLSRDEHEVTLLRLVTEALLDLSPDERSRLLSGYGVSPERFESFRHAPIHTPPLPEGIPLRIIEDHFHCFIDEMAKRVIKDLLMHANPMLRELGRAVDLGVKVVMRTQAFNSNADLLLYELGQMSYAIGVRDEVNRSWMRGIFVPV